MIRYRHEYKYMLDARQRAILQIRARAITQIDPHAGPDGTYIVRSVYFDDMNDSSLLENLSGTDPRKKYRIRYYNSDTGRIVLEKKSKTRSCCLKESAILTPAECQVFLSGGIPGIRPDDPPIKKRLLYEMQCLGMTPKVIVTYVREPFVFPAGNVRITFDGSITSSNDVGSFLTGRYAQYPVLPEGQTVLEVKWDELMPRHIKDALLVNNLQWTAFSKYALCRITHI